MPPGAVTAQEEEEALQAFLRTLPPGSDVPVRTLAHAWSATGGGLAPGRLAVRLLGPARDDRPPFTAATLYGPRGRRTTPSLELCRAILEHHGVDGQRFVQWCDEVVDLGGPGFDARSKFPTLPLPPDLAPADLARLVSALRDLARMAGA